MSDSAPQATATSWGEPLRLRLQDLLEQFEPRRVEKTAGRRRAAVTLTVVPEDGTSEQSAAAVLLTRRSKSLRRHAGQWALPGGRLDPGETDIEAALRELDEELGLCLEPAAVLGVLDDFPTRSGFVITPVVVWGGPARDLRLDPGEVASVHRPTLAAIARPGALHTPKLPWARRPLPVLGILGTLVFAPTAAILHQFGELAVHRRTTRVAHFSQPRFAWK